VFGEDTRHGGHQTRDKTAPSGVTYGVASRFNLVGEKKMMLVLFWPNGVNQKRGGSPNNFGDWIYLIIGPLARLQ